MATARNSNPAASNGSDQGTGAVLGVVRRRAAGGQSGQSLVEFALIAPIFLIILLGVFNLGLAIRAHLQLAQVTQQAAQFLVHHPTLADPDAGSSPATYSQLVAYMNSLSSYTLTPLEVNLTVAPDCTAADGCVQQDTVSVSYPFPLIIPLIGKLNVGLLSGGAIHLGATASTVAATHPVQACTSSDGCPTPPNGAVVSVCVVSPGPCPDVSYSGHSGHLHGNTAGQFAVYWKAPQEANTLLPLPLWYCISVSWIDSNGSHTIPNYTGQNYLNIAGNNSLGCIPDSVLQSSNGKNLYFLDNGTYPSSTSYVSYTVSAMQADGLQSQGLSGAWLKS